MVSEGPSTQRFKTEFLGRYLLQRELGRGGMAVVYEAVDTSLGRRVAVKVMHSRPEATPEQARVDEERFLREARLASALPKHPNIVGVHDAATHRERRYIVMELIDGRPFHDWRAEMRPPFNRQVAILRDVALAVHHAHEHGVVHRDLKPANLLIDAEGRPHITDFGLAKLDGAGSADLTTEGLTVGTPGYMSPEQAKGLKSVDRRADIYSLGVMLYELIAGQQPYQGDSAIEILTQVIRDPVKAPSTILKGRPLTSFDLALEKICLHAMAKDLDRRTPTALALADQLTGWLKESEVGPAPPRSGTSLWPWLVPAAILLLVAAAVLVRPAPKAPVAAPPVAVVEAPPRVVRVSSLQAWTDAGVDVREGEAIRVECEGSWTNHEGARPRMPASGGDRLIGTPYEHYTRTWPVPEGPIMALVAKVGTDGAPWLLPPGRPVRVPATGRLHLGPNDAAPHTDNGGEVTVAIRTQPAAPGDSRVGLEVAGGAAWTDTGIDLQANDVLSFVASGAWGKHANAKPIGAGGEAAAPKSYAGFPVPEGRVMALVGRIGTDGMPWLVPLKDPFRVPGPGRLFLGPNDHPVQDNTGGLRVTVVVERR
jgi:tRNA A-37 threonylcarbamoyl transferase component Bud32